MPLNVDVLDPAQCIFCRLIAGEIPASRVYEDELTLAFMDLGQLNPGHALVRPRKNPPRALLEEYAAQLRKALAAG